MKDTGINMECGACGKPISLTAKFCGKCGAPVKRSVAAEADASTPPLFQATSNEQSTPTEATTAAASAEVQDLVLTLETPTPLTEHASLLGIDLNLVPTVNALERTGLPEMQKAESATPVPQLVQPLSPVWLERWEQANESIQQKLEKHSQLLDFISLNSQQLSHLQTLPNPTEQLLRKLIDSQGQIVEQLNEMQTQFQAPAQTAVLRLPDEFKLTLEKQKIELQKYFSQNVAQNSANIESTSQQTLYRIEALMAANAESAKKLEGHLSPLSQSVTELKTKIQEISKKQESAANKPVKVQSQMPQDSTEGSGGFIIFVIGLLCGLTVVLSSLAIYNFLSRDTGTPVKSAHEAATPATAEHDEPKHDAPANDEPAHSAASSQDKPASDSSKAKSH